jgi:hypothetical protein
VQSRQADDEENVGITSSATEQTTAATDVVVALLALAAIIHLHSLRELDPLKVDLWSWVLGLVGFAALLGAIVHGVDIPSGGVRSLLWKALLLALSLGVAIFVVAAVYDLRGQSWALRVLPAAGAASFVFWIATVSAFQDSFRPLVLYQTVAMVIALGIYLWLAAAGRVPGSKEIALAIILNIVAAGLQSTGTVKVKLLWPFDHHGVCHLVQIAALMVLIVGLHVGLSGASVRVVPD